MPLLPLEVYIQSSVLPDQIQSSPSLLLGNVQYDQEPPGCIPAQAPPLEMLLFPWGRVEGKQSPDWLSRWAQLSELQLIDFG